MNRYPVGPRTLGPILFWIMAVMLLLPSSASAAATYTYGFAHLKTYLGYTMGDLIECIHSNPDNGDILQQTTTGLSFYRLSTNTPTFTDDWKHWAWTSEGLVYWIGDAIDPPALSSPQVRQLQSPSTSATQPRRSPTSRRSHSVMKTVSGITRSPNGQAA